MRDRENGVLFLAVVTIRVVILCPEIIMQKHVVERLLKMPETDKVSPTMSFEGQFPMSFVQNLGEDRLQVPVRVGISQVALDEIYRVLTGLP